MFKKIIFLFLSIYIFAACQKPYIPEKSIVKAKYEVAERTHTHYILSGSVMYPMTRTVPAEFILALDSAGYTHVMVHVPEDFYYTVDQGDSIYYNRQNKTFYRVP